MSNSDSEDFTYDDRPRFSTGQSADTVLSEPEHVSYRESIMRRMDSYDKKKQNRIAKRHANELFHKIEWCMVELDIYLPYVEDPLDSFSLQINQLKVFELNLKRFKRQLEANSNRHMK
jgi:hypothetical protein